MGTHTAIATYSTSGTWYGQYTLIAGNSQSYGDTVTEAHYTITAFGASSTIIKYNFATKKWIDSNSGAQPQEIAGASSLNDAMSSLTWASTETSANPAFVFIANSGTDTTFYHAFENPYYVSGPSVTSITADKIFVPSDTVTNTDFTLLKNGSAYANTNISVTLGNFDPVDEPRFYDYSITYNGTALYSRTIDSKSFHDLYYDNSWTSSPTSSRTTNSSRILAVLGTIPSTANFTVPTVTGQTIGTRTFHDLNRTMRVILTYPAGSTHTQFICYFHVSEINNDIKGKFQSHTLGVTVFDESPFFTIGAQQTMSHTFTINGSNITISVNDWVYSDEPEGVNYFAPVTTTSNGEGKRRYPIISTNLFDRQRSIYSIGNTHKDETLF